MEYIETDFDVREFLLDQRIKGMTSEGVELMDGYIRSCWEKGVSVRCDPSLDAYGTYNTAENTLTLGEYALDSNYQLIETMEHEFMHVLQDEMAGIWNADTQVLGLPVNDYGEAMVNNSDHYSSLSEHEQALEVEAFSIEEHLENPELMTLL